MPAELPDIPLAGICLIREFHDEDRDAFAEPLGVSSSTIDYGGRGDHRTRADACEASADGDPEAQVLDAQNLAVYTDTFDEMVEQRARELVDPLVMTQAAELESHPAMKCYIEEQAERTYGEESGSGDDAKTGDEVQ